MLCEWLAVVMVAGVLMVRMGVCECVLHRGCMERRSGRMGTAAVERPVFCVSSQMARLHCTKRREAGTLTQLLHLL